jgi:hypothetical protein
MSNVNTNLLVSSLTALFISAPVALPQQSSQQAAQPAAAAGAPTQPGAGRGGFGRGGMPFEYENNDGWLSLFDGQSLNGWDGDTRFWGVKDGAIYVEPTCEKPTGTIYLVWKGGEPGDFMLKFESKGTGNVNGGVQFRSYMTADDHVDLRYPGRGGGGALVGEPGRGGVGGGRGPGTTGAAGAQAGRGPGGPGGGGGRGPQCANPGTPPSAAEKAKWDMAGPQFDFDANNRYPGQYYEQSSSRGIAAPP